ncbi:hypothetical protein PHMEG_00037499 [Phytophthora megakarya]|uniref:RxLR effector protein n=1 Tax=Phytophthora megakarya TaxID=4795 RepID=A0A225UJE9_9STRA|nr:hypothetical protein PHMEG_00037499 [Phytophthora megakarya]
MFNKKYPDNQVSLIDMLSARYGDDAVTNALITASKVEQTEDIATKLQAQQLLSWLDRGISTDDVAKKLKISEEGAQFVSSPKLSMLNLYMVLASETHPQANLNYLAIVRNAFGGDRNFATAVMNAVGSGSDTALYFQKKLYKDWFNRKIIPSNTLKTIFGTYRREEKLFVAKYKKYYDAKMKTSE